MKLTVQIGMQQYFNQEHNRQNCMDKVFLEGSEVHQIKVRRQRDSIVLYHHLEVGATYPLISSKLNETGIFPMQCTSPWQ
jgi:hypothetical protein